MPTLTIVIGSGSPGHASIILKNDVTTTYAGFGPENGPNGTLFWSKSVFDYFVVPNNYEIPSNIINRYDAYAFAFGHKYYNGVESFSFSLNNEQFSQIFDKLSDFEKNTPTWSTWSKVCTDYVREALNVIGVEAPGLLPSTMASYLRENYPDNKDTNGFGSNARCFAAGTKILMHDGSEKNIEDIVIGDKVLSFDVSRGIDSKLEVKKVKNLFRNKTINWLKLKYIVNDVFYEMMITPGHRVLNLDGSFCQIKDIVQEGSAVALVNHDGEELQCEVEYICRASRGANSAESECNEDLWVTYNFEVEDFHTYIAGKIRVHNESILDTIVNESDISYFISNSQIFDKDNNLVGISWVRSDGITVHRVGEHVGDTSGGTTYVTHDTLEVPGESIGSQGVRITVDRTYDGVETAVTGSHVTGIEYGPTAFNLGNVGLSLGSAIGNALGGNSFVGRLAAGTIVGTFTQNLAQFAQNGYNISLLENVAGRPASESIIEDAFGAAFNNFGSELFQNGVSNLASGVSGLLMGELAQSLGLTGFTGGLFTTVGTTITSRLITNAFGALTSGGAFDTATLFAGFAPVDMLTSIGGSVGGYFGSYLASQLIQPVNAQAAIGTQLGSTLGAAVGASAAANGALLGLELGSFAGPLGAFIGSFVGTIVGTLLGNAIAPDPEVYNIVGLNSRTHTIGSLACWTANDGDPTTFNSIAKSVSNTVNYIVDLTGAHILSAGSLKFYEKGTTYSVTYTGPDGGYYMFQNRLTTDRQAAWLSASDWASTHLARSLTLEGGDAIARHALETSDGTNAAAIVSDLLIARDYERYIEDPVLINALIAAQPDSTFATGWALTLLRARELGLDLIGRGTDANDAMTGTDMDDHLRGLAGEDVLHGGLGGDFLDGGEGADQLFGDAGDDTLKGGPGTDYLIGGIGDDTYIISSLEDVIVENADEGADTVRTSLASFTLQTDLENLAYTGVGTFDGAGNSADNILQGGAERDRLAGGDGNDTYVVEGVADDIVETATGGIDTVKTTIANYALDTNVENLIYAGQESFTGTGNELNNIITGGIAADVLDGGIGDDILDGGAGADRLIGGAGNDIFLVDNADDVIIENVGEGSDSVQTALTTYVLGSNIENLSFIDVDSSANNYPGWTTVVKSHTGTGNDLDNVITGGAANDVLSGGAGNDTLDGAAGADRLTGGTGDDFYIIDRSSDIIVEKLNEGVDTVKTALAIYSLGANVENLVFTGGGSFTGNGNALNNALTGGRADDILYGGAGSDALAGGLGVDTLDGGAGADGYFWKKGDGADIVSDSSVSLTETDALSLMDVDASDVAATRSGSDLLLAVNSTGEVIRVANQFYEGYDEFGTLITSVMGYGVEQISFSAGVVWGLSDILAHNIVNGTATADYVYGTYNFADQLNGLAGADFLYGYDGNDTLNGGLGSDTLDGGAGADGYVWKKGDGADTVWDSATSLTEADVLILSDVASGDVTLTRSASNLRVAINSTGEAITITNQLYSPGYGYGVESIRFSDGVTWSLGDILSHTVTNGASGNDTINGTSFADNIYGLAGADTINGGAGNDLIDGGLGSDTLNGAAGADGYVWKKGDGADTVWDSATSLTEADVLILSDVASGDVTLTRSASNLRVAINSTGEAITITNQLYSPGYGYGVESIRFSDGVTWSLGDILSHTVTNGASGNDTINGTSFADNIYGLAGADTINGGAGNDLIDGGLGVDTLDGGAGADGYFWKKGDGADIVSDSSVSLTETDALSLMDVDASDVAATRSGSDLLLAVNSTGEVIRVANQFYEGYDEFGTLITSVMGYGVEQISFSAGVVWGLSDILAHNIVNGTATADYVYGTYNFADQLNGLAGADFLYGYDGNDTLNGGLGSDTLDGGAGADGYVWKKGDGADTVWDSATSLTEADVLILSDVASGDVTLTRSASNLRVAINSTGEAITITNQLYSPGYGYGVESIRFSDGVTWSLGDILSHTVTNGASGNDTINGTSFADNIYGLAGADTINGGAGNDLIDGGLGSDTLTGGAGLDTFVFGSALGATNVDKITDFSVSADNILLAQAVFSGTGPAGALAADAFRIGSAATSATDRIIYNSATGALFYDGDGNGSAAQVQFATLATNLSLTAASFRIG